MENRIMNEDNCAVRPQTDIVGELPHSADTFRTAGNGEVRIGGSDVSDDCEGKHVGSVCGCWAVEEAGRQAELRIRYLRRHILRLDEAEINSLQNEIDDLLNIAEGRANLN